MSPFLIGLCIFLAGFCAGYLTATTPERAAIVVPR